MGDAFINLQHPITGAPHALLTDFTYARVGTVVFGFLSGTHTVNTNYAQGGGPPVPPSYIPPLYPPDGVFVGKFLLKHEPEPGQCPSTSRYTQIIITGTAVLTSLI